MKKLEMCMLFLLVFIVAGCKEKGNNIPKNKKRTAETIVERLQREIKERTERDLKKLGIKKMLLINNGKWGSEIFGGRVIFQNNGEVVVENRGRHVFYYWKVIDNTLYLSQTGLTIKYLKATVEPKKSTVNTILYLKRCKYSLYIKTEDNAMSFDMDKTLGY